MKAFRKDDMPKLVTLLLQWRDINDRTVLTTLYDNSIQTVIQMEKKIILEKSSNKLLYVI